MTFGFPIFTNKIILESLLRQYLNFGIFFSMFLGKLLLLRIGIFVIYPINKKDGSVISVF